MASTLAIYVSVSHAFSPHFVGCQGEAPITTQTVLLSSIAIVDSHDVVALFPRLEF
jgi:hypothetical protein